MRKNREELARVYQDVIKDIQRGYYECNGDFIDFVDQDRMRNDTLMYSSLAKITSTPFFKNTKTYAQNIDTFMKAIELGPDCAVLNMASHKHPGGGVANGSRAQEEELCRRSNLLYSLYPFTALGKSFFGFQQKAEYPIPRYGGIYSPGVTIYREPGTYKTMIEPKTCSVISVPGVVCPEVDEVTRMMKNPKDISLVKGKIRSILRIAIDNNHSKLVLGALGCGAFRNPPRHVAMLFDEILKEQEFRCAFEEICFAILEDSNSLRPENPEGNLKPFIEIFGENE